MPTSQFSSFSWRHGGHRNGRRPLPQQPVRTLQQQLTWSRGAPRPLRNWEKRYGVAEPLVTRQVACARCGSAGGTLHRWPGNRYICGGCLDWAARRGRALDPNQGSHPAEGAAS